MMNWKSATSLHPIGISLAITVFSFTARAQEASSTTRTNVYANTSSGTVQEMTLEECLNMAMDQSHRRPASKFAVAMAEAQHRQALSGYWPQVTLMGAYRRADEAPNFLFPASTLPVPPQSLAIPGGAATVTLPAGTFGSPVPLELPISFGDQTIDIPAQQFAIPPQDLRLMDRDSFLGSVNAIWLLYDGGMRKGYREQANGWLDLVKQEARRTDLELADSVKRLYYGAILARQVHKVGKDTLARMEATLNLTEAMYKEGSGTVMKTDYLDNKVVVESLRSAVALLDKNEQMTQAALANTMGLSWNMSVSPADREIPYNPFNESLENLVSAAYQFSPDWARVEAGIRAAEGAVRTAKSGHYPKLALTGELHRWWNDFGSGLATDQNKEGWSVGVGVEIPLFSGFFIRNKVSETRAHVSQIKEQRFLLKEGIALQIKNIFLSLIAAQKSDQATLDAMKSAQENRDLNTRAYQNELVETEQMIRAQLVEALMAAQHYKTRYDHIALQSRLNLAVGTEVMKQLRFAR